MEKILKLLQQNKVTIDLPSPNGKTKIDVSLNDFGKVNGKINISVDVDFKEKYLTENILKFYIRKQIKQYLKLFSIDEDVKMDFNFIKN